jgi:ketol-acid reductoisomerase
MREFLAEIRSGAFAQEWVAEHAAGKPRFAEFRRQGAAHPIEEVGRKLRALMPWLRKSPAGATEAPESWHAAGTPHGFRMM